MNNKREKGSVTLFILISCMFMIIILLVVNIGVMNKNRSQEKELEEISKQYNQNETDLNSAYDKTVDDEGYLTKEEIREMLYPVGSIYITTNEQNPSEYIGGKWERYGEGRAIVGAGTGTDENNVQKMFEINETGGEYEHILTVDEMPNHYHNYYRQYVGSGYTDYNNQMYNNPYTANNYDTYQMQNNPYNAYNNEAYQNYINQMNTYNQEAYEAYQNYLNQMPAYNYDTSQMYNNNLPAYNSENYNMMMPNNNEANQ